MSRFEQVKTMAPKDRVLLAVNGSHRSGKSSFGLSAPGPIAYIDFDLSLEGVVEKYLREGKRVDRCTYDIPRELPKDSGNAVQDKCKEIWKQYLLDLQDALNTPLYRSIVVDTASDLWEIVRYSRFGKLEQVESFHYGQVNRLFKSMLYLPVEANCCKNFILLHKTKKKYDGKDWSGEYEMSGYGETPYIVQCCVRLEFDWVDKRFKLLVENCRFDYTLSGIELYDDMVNFDTLKTLLFPE